MTPRKNEPLSESKKRLKRYNQKYYKLHSKEIRKRTKEYYLKNYNRLYPKLKKYKQEYKKRHPERVRLIWIRRRMRLKGIPGSHTSEQIRFLKNISGGFCPGYKRDSHHVGKEKLAADHIQPVTLPNGQINQNCTDDIKNIQLLCKSCNSRKWSNPS